MKWWWGIGILGGLLIGFGVWWYFQLLAPPTRWSAQNILVSEPSPDPTPALSCARILFGGDLMFDRHIREKAQGAKDYDFTLASLSAILSDNDAVVANLEGPITTFASKSVGSAVGSTNNYLFTFDPAVLSTLQKFPLIANLGNNHILNFGAAGLTQTQTFLAEAEIPYFGATGIASSSAQRSLIRQLGNQSFGFANYNQFIPAGEELILAEIAWLRPQVDWLIVYAHWGNEYVPENEVIRQLAQQLVTAGADAIIGSHPHVVQGKEFFQAKPIYYSLGNFVFDQYFEPAVQEGLLVRFQFCADRTLSTQEFPIQMLKTGETRLLL